MEISANIDRNQHSKPAILAFERFVVNGIFFDPFTKRYIHIPHHERIDADSERFGFRLVFQKEFGPKFPPIHREWFGTVCFGDIQKLCIFAPFKSIIM